MLNKDTVLLRDNKKVAATDLKIGRSVVVDALGDSYADLVALEVRLVLSEIARGSRPRNRC